MKVGDMVALGDGTLAGIDAIQDGFVRLIPFWRASNMRNALVVRLDQFRTQADNEGSR